MVNIEFPSKKRVENEGLPRVMASINNGETLTKEGLVVLAVENASNGTEFHGIVLHDHSGEFMIGEEVTNYYHNFKVFDEAITIQNKY